MAKTAHNAQSPSITLQPEQEKVLKLPAKGAILVKGVAGSGKTTISLHRAKYLMDNHSDLFNKNKTAIFTYNRLLSNYLENLKKDVVNCYNDEIHENRPLNAYITNFHRWAYKFMQNYDRYKNLHTVSSKEKENILKTLLSSNKYLQIEDKSLLFLSEEISWIKGKLISSLEEYQAVSRKGRGTSERISQSQRLELWEFLQAYNGVLYEKQSIDFDDYAIICYNLIAEDPNFVPPYTHIVVDEAQDLSKAQLLVIKSLVDPQTNSITIVADSAQKIYKSGFTWDEVGFQFKGNTCVLKRNYRGTISISRAALSLLDKDPQREEFTQIESARRGDHTPIIYKATSFKEQWGFLNSLLPKLLAEFKTVVLLLKNKTDIESFAHLLTLHKYNPQVLSKSKDLPIEQTGLFLCTYTSSKGLEFDVVFILNCNYESFPYPKHAKNIDEEHISTHRRKLFTSMTRAREQLYIIASDQKYSPFLDDIDKDHVEIVSL